MMKNRIILPGVKDRTGLSVGRFGSFIYSGLVSQNCIPRGNGRLDCTKIHILI